MRVVKRNGDLEEVSFDKVLRRIKKLSEDLRGVNVVEIAQKVCGRIFDGVCTRELDELTGQMCSSMIIEHPDYGTLAARIAISNHHKNTSPSFSETVKLLYANVDAEGKHNPLVAGELMNTVEKHWEKLNSYIDYSRDFMLDYFGFKTLEKSYLMRVNGRVVERPQHLWMRVALGIHGEDLKDALLTYDLMSQKYFTHATPTLFNAGTPRPQCSSCYLHAINGDSVTGIFQSLSECAHISKYSGGIGMHIHDIRCKGSRIRGTNGVSDGIIPMLRVFNNTARYINQCFLPDTTIYVVGGVKRMDAVKWGDTLMTHDGTFKQVHGISKKHVDNKQILMLTTGAGALPVHVTPEHEVFAWKKGAAGPAYMPVSEVSVGDEMGYPIPTHSKPSKLMDDDFTFYGIMLRCGYAAEDDAGLMTRQFADVEFVERYLADRNIIYRWSDVNGSFRMHWKPAGGIMHDIYGPNGVDKVMHQDFWELSKEHTAALSRGLFDGKGVIHTSSYAMVAAARYVLLKLGIGCDVSMTECTFSVQMDKNAKVSNGLVWTDVKSISWRVYSGSVYDFNMVDNHNYTVVDLGLVHNSGKRNGSIAVYLEPWHGDIEQFLDLRKNHGNEEERCRDLFLALWIPDLFMERVEANGMWSLMCPDTSRGLSEAYGEDFRKLYEGYEAKGLFVKQVRAQDLWFKMLESQIETGTPYMLFKDAANNKSNHKNLGTIKSSNLCIEIVQFSSPDETAVCNLASVGLPMFVDVPNGSFDFDNLHRVVKVMTKNLNKVIDKNFYPIEKARKSNLLHRPIGIGVQGLADTFAMLRVPFESKAAAALNTQVFETIYHAALEASMEIAKRRHDVGVNAMDLNEYERDLVGRSKYPGAYATFEGSPVCEGVLQFDMWGAKPEGSRHDWDALRAAIKRYGVRNSLLIAPMPTASTAQILGNNESFEPFTSNLFKRKTMSGEFIVVNKYLLNDLIRLGLWNTQMKDLLMLHNGSVQNIDIVPEDIKELYKTVWEIKQKSLIDMSADRGIYIDQSQSMNLFVEDPDYKKLTSMHFYSWRKGLKCGLYYLRTRPRATTQQFTIDPTLSAKQKMRCTEEVCTMCSS